MKNIFNHFLRATIEANNKKNLEGESPTLAVSLRGIKLDYFSFFTFSSFKKSLFQEENI